MTQGHMDRSGGGGATWHALLCVDRFFLSSRIGCDLHDRRRLRTCRWRQREKEGRRKKFVIGEKLIRIIFDQSMILSNFQVSLLKISFLSFLFLLIGRDHPPARPGRSSTPIFILRTATGTLWEDPGDLPHSLPVISGPPGRKVCSSPRGV
jgi:hypothetical protein